VNRAIDVIPAADGTVKRGLIGSTRQAVGRRRHQHFGGNGAFACVGLLRANLFRGVG
jgi:hypothetical protein